MPEPTEQDNYLAQKLLEVIDAQSADGAHRFSDEDVRHILPLLLLRSGAGLSGESLSNATQELVGQFAVEAGITAESSADEIAAAVESYYAERPPNAELFDALTKLFETLAAESGDAAGLSSAVKTLLGNEASNRPVGGAPAPEGGFKGGLLGRLAAHDALKKDK